MIRDLTGTGSIRERTNFVIVGGGTVGLFLSVWLAEAGLDVICVESGGLQQDTDEHVLNEVVQLQSIYAGAANGRYRCIGGTSTRWGGALIPFQKADLERAHWPIDIGELLPYLSKIENEFGLVCGSYEVQELSSKTHTARLAKWPPFKKRNVFNLLKNRVKSLPNLTVWLNATVTDFVVHAGLLRSIVARSMEGDIINIVASETIIAAGAIESTRLALLLDAQNSHVVSKTSPALGKYFSDHLSVVVGEIASSNKAELNRHLGFRFENNGTMRNLRFELSEDVQTREEHPASFAHVGFETGGSGGFDHLKTILRSIQMRQAPRIGDILGLVRAAPWLSRAVWARLVRKRLLFPDGAKLPVHMVIDQEPIIENSITLSKDRMDIFGRPMVEITWGVSERDQSNLTRLVDSFESMWGKLRISSQSIFVRLPDEVAIADLAKGGGIFHPTGSTRMASTCEGGVADRDLRLSAVSNVRIVSTSALPSGGGANPTMMLLLLAARCASQLTQ